jgi:hypothetical protein
MPFCSTITPHPPPQKYASLCDGVQGLVFDCCSFTSLGEGLVLPAGPLGPAQTIGKWHYLPPELRHLSRRGVGHKAPGSSSVPAYSTAMDICCFGSSLYEVLHARSGKRLNPITSYMRQGAELVLVEGLFEGLPTKVGL